MAVELIAVVIIDMKVSSIHHEGHSSIGEGREVLMCGVVWYVLYRMCE